MRLAQSCARAMCREQAAENSWHFHVSSLEIVKVSAVKVFLNSGTLKLIKVIWQEIKCGLCSLNLLIRVTSIC